MTDLNSLLLPPPDAETQWRRFEQLVRLEQHEFFDGEGPIAGARAPGRLDIMGGVADYSGSIVLEMPIAEAAFAAWQWRNDRQLRIRSLGLETEGLTPEVVLSLDDLVMPEGHMRSVEDVRSRLATNPKTRWAGYVAGCYYVMLTAYGKISNVMNDARTFEHGANILVSSDVPLGAGVSSSAAIEVATMHALSEAAGIEPSDMTLAAWCQRVENSVVGAPCGIMDQVSCALGRESSLVVLRCQPHDLLGNQVVPPGWRLVGIDSGVKHSVAGGHYIRARVGAFMGLKIIQLESGGKLLDNYLCRMTSEDFGSYRDLIPESITGAEYHRLYGRLPDDVTTVDPDETYHPRACAEHPILENERAWSFVSLMQLAGMWHEERTATVRQDDVESAVLQRAGQLMYDSHQSYGERLDLGAPETDLLVELIRERGPEQGLYGGRITGGGSGGTVAVLCSANTTLSNTSLADVCRVYGDRTGNTPRLFVGSSPGAVIFGARQIMRG